MLERSDALDGIKIAILATDGFELSELFAPKAALENAGAQVEVISPKSGSIIGWKDGNWSHSIEVDNSIDNTNAGQYDALMLPGGVMNPDRLRIDKEAIKFVQDFVSKGKPIAAICHGPQILIETGVVKGKKMTSWPSIRTDLLNAGAYWVDEEVIVDQGLITSRRPSDIPAFNRKMIEEFAKAFHNRTIPGAEGYSLTL